MSSIEQTDAQTTAETCWRAVVDAQRDDLALMRSLWPQTKAPEFLAVQDRLRRRAAHGGDVDEAMGAIHAAYGGHDRVPQAVHDRLERYVWEQLGGRPSPDEVRALPRYRPATRRTRRGDDDR